MKTPAAAIPDVIGIAVSMASGVNANYGTMTKPLHAGHAARNGMAAAMLGKAGLSASHAALEGRGGFFAAFARGMPGTPSRSTISAADTISPKWASGRSAIRAAA